MLSKDWLTVHVNAQVYLLLSCAPCEGRISGIVDVPNACATLALPTKIFDKASSKHQALCLGPYVIKVIREPVSRNTC